MINPLICNITRIDGSSSVKLEFSKKFNTREYPLLLAKFEVLAQNLNQGKEKYDNIKIIVNNEGHISISVLENNKFIEIKDVNKKTNSLMQSISNTAKKMNITALKEEKFNPYHEHIIRTHHLFGKETPKNKPDSFSFKNFFKELDKKVATNFIVKPLVKHIIKCALKGKSIDQTKELYIDNERFFSFIKAKILQKNSAAFNAVPTEDIESIINNTLIELCKLKEPDQFNDKKIYDLDVLRILNSLEKHEHSQKEYEKLFLIPPLNIPIEKLAKIPITEENKEILTKLWSNLLLNMYSKGNLSNLYSGNKEQIKYVLSYSEAVSKLPESLKDDVNREVLTLENDLPNKLKDKTSNRYLNFDSSTFFLHALVNAGDYLRVKKIFPENEDKINVLYSLNFKIGTYARNLEDLDGLKLTKTLVDFDLLHSDSKKMFDSLPENSKKLLSHEEIYNYFIAHLEKKAAEKYKITGAQLNGFRNMRNLLKDKPGVSVDPQEKDKELRLARYDALKLYDLAGKFEPEEIEIYKNFILLSKYLEFKDVSEIDRKKIGEFLANIENDPVVKKILDQHISDKNIENRSYIEVLLESTPKFMHPLIHRFINPKKYSLEVIPYGISKDAFDFARKHISNLELMKTSEKSLEEVQKKAQILIEKYKSDPASIKPEERLTLQEMGLLSKSSHASRELNDFLINENFNTKHKKTLETSSRSQVLLKEITDIISPSLPKHYTSGDLLAYSYQKKSKWHNRSGSIEERLTAFASDGFTHGGKILKENDEIKVSHLIGGVVKTDLDLYTMCISDIYAIDIKQLITPNMQMMLKKHYGDEWFSHVNKIYLEAEEKIHSTATTQFENIRNSQTKRVRAALANSPRLAKFITGDQKVKGHKKSEETSRAGTYNAFFHAKSDKNQICSEWASKATLAAMMETNKILSQELAGKTGYSEKQILEKLSEQKIPSDVREYLTGERYWKNERAKTVAAEKKLIALLKKSGVEKKEIELIIRMGNNEIFDVPYSRKERLKAIHPGRMVELLEKKNCLVKRELPDVVAKMIKVE